MAQPIIRLHPQSASPKRDIEAMVAIWDEPEVLLSTIERKAFVGDVARLIYLPPYSPDFSPIENFWSKFKNSLKNLGAKSYQALSEAIETAFAEISKADIQS